MIIMIKKIWAAILICFVVVLFYWIVFVPKLYYLPDYYDDINQYMSWWTTKEDLLMTMWTWDYQSTPQDYLYSHDFFTVYLWWEIVPHAYPSTFIPLIWNFGVDPKQKIVFVWIQAFTWIDFKSLSFIPGNYFHFYDKNCLYFAWFWNDPNKIQQLRCIPYSGSLSSLHPGHDIYVKDDQHVFYMGSILSWAYPDDVLITGWKFLISSWKVFDQWVLLTGAKATTFVATGVRLRMTGDDGTGYYINKQAWYDGDQYYY